MVEWRCVSMALGEPSVMTSGTTEMPVWCADSWDTPHMVWFSNLFFLEVVDNAQHESIYSYAYTYVNFFIA